MVFSFEKNMN